MQTEVQQFSALLQSLNLTAGLFKPTPGPLLLSTLGNISSFNPFGVLANSSIASSDPLDFNIQGSCNPEPYSAPPVTDQEFPQFDSAKATIFRYRQQQSVNLGSWLVTKPWPSSTAIHFPPTGLSTKTGCRRHCSCALLELEPPSWTLRTAGALWKVLALFLNVTGTHGSPNPTWTTLRQSESIPYACQSGTGILDRNTAKARTTTKSLLFIKILGPESNVR